MSYSDYGLDEVKKSEDEGIKGSFYCPWCKRRDIESGFSLCFSNFCICLDCINSAKALTEQWKPDDGVGCFKCSKGKKGKKVFDKLFYDPASGLSICEECIEWGKDVLTNQEKYFNDMVQDILKRCVVEGNVVKLPEGQLDRKEYLDVKNKLELIGGNWKGNKIQGFVFEEDPTELLEDLKNGDDRNLKKEFQFFATPKVEAISMAELVRSIVTPETKWLEPEAGDGALVKAIIDLYGGMYGPITVDCYELMGLNRRKLEKIPGVNILGYDFFNCDRKDYYDVIIANPPFTKNQDIDHIRKMFEVLKPGGTIVTLCSQSWYMGSQKKQVEFKEWLESMGVYPFTLPAKSFQESGTNITPLRLMIQKPVVEQELDIDKAFGPAVIPQDLGENIEMGNSSEPELNPLYVFYLKVTGKTNEDKLYKFINWADTTAEAYKKATNSPVITDPEAYIKWVGDNLASFTVRSCRICGCTDDNCLQCIEKTGRPCVWVDDDLCSACVNEESSVIVQDTSLETDVSPIEPSEKSHVIVQDFSSEMPKSVQILHEIKQTNKEIDKGILELKQMLSSDQTKDMNFFKQLFDLVDGIDVTLRIKRIDGKLKLEVLPQTGASLRSAVIAGTPEDLDAGFFEAITVPVQKAKGLKLEFDDFHKSVVAAKEELAKKPEEVKPAEKVTEKEKPTAPKHKVEKPKEDVKHKVAEPSLFD